VTTQSAFPTQSAISQQQFKLQQQQQQQQQLELQLKQQQQQLAAAADAETKRLFANGASHIMQVNQLQLYCNGLVLAHHSVGTSYSNGLHCLSVGCEYLRN